MEIYGFDAETSPFELNQKVKLYGWYAYSENKSFIGNSREEFINMIQTMYDNMTDDIIFIAHNLAFDYFMLMISKNIRTQKKCNSTIRVFNHPSFAYFSKIINYRTGKGTTRKKRTIRLHFIDLANFVGKIPLSKVAKDFEVIAKEDKSIIWTYHMSQALLSVDDQIKNYMSMMEYCKIDSRICHDIYKYIIENSLFDKIRYTINSIGYTALKLETGWKPFKRYGWIKRIERRAFFGGRTGYNKNRTLKWISAWSIDVKSLYPYIMSIMKVPISFIGKVENIANQQHKARDIIKRIHLSDDITSLITCEVIFNKPVLPYRKENGSICFDHIFEGQRTQIVGTWSDEELYPALKDGEIELLKVSQIIMYECKKGIFKPFFEKRFQIKENSKGAKKAMAKLEMNGGGYGKTVQRHITTRTIDEIKDDVLTKEEKKHLIDNIADLIGDYGVYDYISESNVKLTINKQGQDIYIEKIEEYESWGACSIVGVITTAKARRYFWEEMRKYWHDDLNNVISHDTDGFKVACYPDETKIASFPFKMGDWAFENCKGGLERCDYMIFGKKDYTCIHASKQKGVPQIDIFGKNVRPSWKAEEHIKQFHGVLKPIEAYRRKLIPYSVIKRTKSRKDYLKDQINE